MSDTRPAPAVPFVVAVAALRGGIAAITEVLASLTPAFPGAILVVQHLGCSVTFTDITDFKRLQNDLTVANRQLEIAYEELQSTNEELETMNDELQSTNEELETMNDELRQRGEELNQVNGFLESILASLRGAVVVVAPNLLVQVWNHHAEDLWGLRRDEVEGKPFLNIDAGLPVDLLKPCLRACLHGEADGQELIVPATNRRGKPITCRVTCSPLLTPSAEVRGAILVMEEQEAGARCPGGSDGKKDADSNAGLTP